MSNLTLDLPINNLSFGNVSIGILRQFYLRGLYPNVFPLGGHIDLNAQVPDEEFNRWLNNCISRSNKNHSRKDPSVKLWHINGASQTYSSTSSRLITFHETDQLTDNEVNILKNQDVVYVTSRFTQQVFAEYGISSEYLPLGFDSHNFEPLNPRPKIAGVTSWGLGGKFEVRKNHHKIINLWAKKYGNKREHRLNLALFNPFFHQDSKQAWEMTLQAIRQAAGGNFWNIVAVPHMATNAEYNNFLNANDIFFAMSGGEGRGLPEYHATALGAHTVALNAHSYRDFLNDSNAVMVKPSAKRPAADGMFFQANGPFNTGNFFDFSEEDFYAGCELAEKRAATGINEEGLKLQHQTYAQTVDILLKSL